MFVNKVPRREFKTYQCVSSERAREIAEQQLDDISKGGVTVHSEKISV
jgi:c-di-GMP-binding flagellar brake protein YcgR